MTTQQILMVKRSWSVIQKIDAAIVADVFYSKLFSDKPALRKMFPEDMQAQYQKLIEMINLVIARLDRLEELTPDIAAMAIRHKGYGVKTHHYQLVGNALLWTLQKGIGNAWTDELNGAWMACYTILSTTMINAAAEHR